ncbi:MAG: hypothetical protein AMXMBFR64_30200 [Myxococcales bacterium]
MGVKKDEQEQVATGEVPRTAPPGEEAGERSEPASGAQGGAVRGRPGRRTVAERREAVLAVLSGKASVDQVARRYGVLPETMVGWREQALGGIEAVLARGDSRSPRERELEREVVQLRDLVASLSVERALAVKAIEEWKRQSHPSQPARSRR